MPSWVIYCELVTLLTQLCRIVTQHRNYSYFTSNHKTLIFRNHFIAEGHYKSDLNNEIIFLEHFLNFSVTLIRSQRYQNFVNRNQVVLRNVRRQIRQVLELGTRTRYNNCTFNRIWVEPIVTLPHSHSQCPPRASGAACLLGLGLGSTSPSHVHCAMANVQYATCNM